MASDDESTASERTIRALKVSATPNNAQDSLQGQSPVTLDPAHEEPSRSSASEDPLYESTDTPSNIERVQAAENSPESLMSAELDTARQSSVINNTNDHQDPGNGSPGLNTSGSTSKQSCNPVLGIHAVFSTEFGKYLPRATAPNPPLIVHSDYESDVKKYVHFLRTKFSETCWSIFSDPNIKPHGWDIRWFFDQYDFETMGGGFCIDTINTIVRQNEDEVVKYSIDFIQKNPYPWEIFARALYGSIEKLFSPEDLEKRSQIFLVKVREYMISTHERMLHAFAEHPPTTMYQNMSGAVETVSCIPPNPPQSTCVGSQLSSEAREFSPSRGNVDAPRSVGGSFPINSNTYPHPPRSPRYQGRLPPKTTTLHPQVPPEGYHMLSIPTQMLPNDHSLQPALAMSRMTPGTAQLAQHHLPPFAPGPVPYPHILPFQQHPAFGHHPLNPQAALTWQAGGELPVVTGHQNQNTQLPGVDVQISMPQIRRYTPTRTESLIPPPVQTHRNPRKAKFPTPSGPRRGSFSTSGTGRGSSASMSHNVPTRPHLANSEIVDRNARNCEQDTNKIGSEVGPHTTNAQLQHRMQNDYLAVMSPNRNRYPIGDYRITSTYIGKDVDYVKELFVANASDIDNESLLRHLGTVAQIVELRRGDPPKRFTIVKFLTTQDTRRVLDHACQHGFTINGQDILVYTTFKDRTEPYAPPGKPSFPVANHAKSLSIPPGRAHGRPPLTPQSTFKEGCESHATQTDVGIMKPSGHKTPHYSPQDARSSLYRHDAWSQNDTPRRTETTNAVLQPSITANTFIVRNKDMTQIEASETNIPRLIDPSQSLDTIPEMIATVDKARDINDHDVETKPLQTRNVSKPSSKKKNKSSKSSTTENQTADTGEGNINTGEDAPLKNPSNFKAESEASQEQLTQLEQALATTQIENTKLQGGSPSPAKIQPAVPKSFAQAAKNVVPVAGSKPRGVDHNHKSESEHNIQGTKDDRELCDDSISTSSTAFVGAKGLNTDSNNGEPSKGVQCLKSETPPDEMLVKRDCSKITSLPLQTHQNTVTSKESSETSYRGKKSNLSHPKSYSAVASSNLVKRSHKSGKPSDDTLKKLKTNEMVSSETTRPETQASSVAEVERPLVLASKTVNSTLERTSKLGESPQDIQDSAQQPTEDTTSKAIVLSPFRNLLAWEKDIQELLALAQRTPVVSREEKIAEAESLQSSLKEARDELDTIDSKCATLSGNSKKKLLAKRKKKTEVYESLKEDLALKIGQYRRREVERQQRSFSGSRYSGVGKGERMSLVPHSYRFSSCPEVGELNVSSSGRGLTRPTQDSSIQEGFEEDSDQLLERSMTKCPSLVSEITLQDGEECQVPEGYTTSTGEDVVIQAEDLSSDGNSEQGHHFLTGLGISGGDSNLPKTNLDNLKSKSITLRCTELDGRSDSEIARDLKPGYVDTHEQYLPDNTLERCESVEGSHSKHLHRRASSQSKLSAREQPIGDVATASFNSLDPEVKQPHDCHNLQRANEHSLNQFLPPDTLMNNDKDSLQVQDQDAKAEFASNAEKAKVRQLIGDAAQKIMDQYELYKTDESEHGSTCKENRSSELRNEAGDSSFSSTNTVPSATETAPTSPTMSVVSTNSQAGGMSWAKVASQGATSIDTKRRPSVTVAETSQRPLSVATNLKSSTGLHGAGDAEVKVPSDMSKIEKEPEQDPWAVEKGNTWGKKSASRSKGI